MNCSQNMRSIFFDVVVVTFVLAEIAIVAHATVRFTHEKASDPGIHHGAGGLSIPPLHPGVEAILRDLDMVAEYGPAFRENNVDLDAFSYLTNELLKDLGVASAGARAKLLHRAARARITQVVDGLDAPRGETTPRHR